jgi:dihydrofolate reductase
MRQFFLPVSFICISISFLPPLATSYIAARPNARRATTKFRLAGSMKGSVYIATTLDGKIADPTGDVGFLDEYQSSSDGDMGFGDFLASVDVIVMGRKSFEKVVSFGEAAWPYGSTEVVVWSRQGLHNIPEHVKETVSWSNWSPRELFQELENNGKKHAYIDGGQTVQSFLKAHLVHSIIITQVPIILGPGIRLFSDDSRCKLELEKSEAFSNGLVQNTYRVIGARKTT